MGNFRKSARVSCSDHKGGKRAQRIQKQTASQSSTLKRVTEQKERLELEKLDLENEIKSLCEPTPLLRPPEHVLDLESTIRAQTARQKGTIVSFNDSYLVLKVYANFILSPQCQSHTESTTTALQMSRRTVFDIVKQCSEVGRNIRGAQCQFQRLWE